MHAKLGKTGVFALLAVSFAAITCTAVAITNNGASSANAATRLDGGVLQFDPSQFEGAISRSFIINNENWSTWAHRLTLADEVIESKIGTDLVASKIYYGSDAAGTGFLVMFHQADGWYAMPSGIPEAWIDLDVMLAYLEGIVA